LFALFPADFASKFAKSAKMPKKYFFQQKSLWVSKNAEFYADFILVKKVQNIHC